MLSQARTLTQLARQTANVSARGFSTTRVARVGVAEWIQDMTTRPPTVDKDVIVRGRADQLIRTLPTRNADLAQGSVLEGSLLPKGHHMIYWQPEAWMEELAPDGTSTEYNAPEPYTRRMWAGGAFEWKNDKGLKVGGQACQTSTVERAEEKSGMMFVYKDYKYYDTPEPTGDWVMREERTHVFFPEKNEAKKDSTKKAKKPKADDLPKPVYTFKYTPSSPLLFRFSALTWNAHKIHYDKDWAKNVEGHPDLVVHGPLTAALLVELADQAAGDVGANLTRFDYRATSPMYVSKEITLNAAWDGPRGKKLTLWAEQDGKVGMKGTATYQ